MKRENTNINKDWLDEFHDGLSEIREGLHVLNQIKKSLSYTFPHIAEDISFSIEDIEQGIKKVNSAMNNNMNESLQNHNEFVGNMFYAMLHVKEEE